MKVGFFLHSPCAAHCEQPVLASEQRAVAHVPHDSMLYFDVRCVELRAEPWWGRRGGLASEAVPPPTRFMTAPSEREARMVAP